MKKLLILLLASNSIFALDSTQSVNSSPKVSSSQEASSKTSAVLKANEPSEQKLAPAQIDDTKDELAIDDSKTIKNQFTNFGVGVNVGTLGLGLDISHPVYKDYLSLRFNANYLKYNSTIQNNPYAINLNSYGLLLDYMPFSNNFRLSGGLYYNNNNLQIQQGSSSIEFNGTKYNTSQFSNLGGSITFPVVSPYVGIGYGSKSAYAENRGGFYFSGDIGVLISTPTVNLNATCNAGVGVDCATFNNNVQAQKVSIQNTINSYAQFYPVINLGFGYRF